MAARFFCEHRGGNPGRLKWGPVEEDTTGEGAGDVQVLNCGVVPLGDQSRQESRVGDTGDTSGQTRFDTETVFSVVQASVSTVRCIVGH